MTNFERIKNMTVEELAKILIKWHEDATGWNTDYYMCSDGTRFYYGFSYEEKMEMKKKAIQHEIECLNSESDVSYEN